MFVQINGNLVFNIFNGVDIMLYISKCYMKSYQTK